MVELGERRGALLGVELLRLVGGEPGDGEHGEGDEDAAEDHEEPHPGGEGGEEGEQVDGLGRGLHVEDADAWKGEKSFRHLFCDGR